MRVAVMSFKGGVGKTTTAVHLAAFLHQRGTTILLDGDLNGSAVEWARAGRLPFQITPDAGAVARVEHAHLVIDTGARPDPADLAALIKRCDLLVLPATPDGMSLRALLASLGELQRLGAQNYRVLLTLIPPRPSRDGEDARQMLRDSGIATFRAGIRRLVAFQKAALAGCLVHEADDPRGPLGWDDYRAAGRELLK
jgi:chromosome partitioning protein